MKRIIELSDDVVKAIQNGEDYRYDIHTAIAQSKPYNPAGDCISREALKEALQYKSECIDCSDECCTSCFYDIIDNAPTIKIPPVINMKPLTAEEKQGLINALKKSGLKVVNLDDERPKCDCEKCDYRKFTEKFVDGFVDVLNKYGITSIEQLSEILKGGDNT